MHERGGPPAAWLFIFIPPPLFSKGIELKGRVSGVELN